MSIRSLPPHLQEKAEKELNEHPTRQKEDLQHIEEWLQKQPHLHARKEPQFLLNFLRCSKHSLQRTKEKLDYFYTMKTLTPEFFMDKDPYNKEIKEVLDNAGIFPITKSTAEANIPTIVLLRWGTFNPDTVHFASLCKAVLMCLDVLLNEDDNLAVNGLHFVHDMKGFSLGYTKHLTPALCKKIVLSIQNAYPIRLKGLYFINTPAIYEVFINMFIPFYNEKMRSRIVIFREDAKDKLNNYIPLEVFPEEYDAQKINDKYREKLEQYKEWFVKDEQFRSDENKRPGKPITSADVFGVEGSFRKLNVD